LIKYGKDFYDKYFLALDGWSSPRNTSVWNFIIHTPTRKQFLYQLKDFSSESHTANYIANQIEDVINKIGSNKFSAIVSDGAANLREARKIISKKFPNILNIRCIAHCIHLISKDIIKHKFAKQLLSNCNSIVKYFKKSYCAGSLLNEAISRYNIKGGSLKNYSRIRWTSAYETVDSMIRLQPCFDLVILKIDA
jgi:hypothetical protein